MTEFLQAAAAVLMGLILSQLLSNRDKSFASLLSMGICAMVLLLGLRYFNPVVDFLRELEDLGNLQSDLVKILLKVTGISIVTQIASLLCADSGNGSLAQSLRILSSGVILWLSLPVFRALLELIHRIMEGI